MELQFERTGMPGCEQATVEDVRARLLKFLDDSVALGGTCASHCVFVRPDAWDSLPLDGLADLGDECLLAALLRTLTASEGVRFGFRYGEVALPDGETSRRAVCVLQWIGGDAESWWLATRWLGQGEARTGLWHGEWRESTGSGHGQLPEPLQEWLDPEKTEMGSVEHGPTRPVEPDIRAAFMDWAEALPDDGKIIAQILGERLGVDRELITQGQPAILAFVWRTSVLERWEIKGRLPTDLDDFLRGVAAQEPTQAIALVHPCVVNLDGVQHRGFATVVQRHDTRVRRVLVVRMGPDGRPANFRAFITEEVKFAEGQGWIGVAPKNEIEFTALGMEDVAGNRIPGIDD